ncbi:MAG: hypothetical protein ABI353_15015 [Isosphaeraceae bacterium]
MNDHDLCCRQPAHLRERRSPFHRVIAPGWHDGPTSGLLECGVCERDYRFELFDEVINDPERRDVRTYSLAPLMRGSLDRLVDALALYQSPRQPVWVPLWTFPTEAAREALDNQTQRILDSAGPPELAITTDNLVGTIVEAKNLTAEDLVRGKDWFSFMGLAKVRAKV